MTPALLADPIAEARRIIELAESDGLVLRALGGVAVCMQAPDGTLRLPRRGKDIDLFAAKGSSRPAVKVMLRAGYVADEMFNALRGSRRLLFQDPANGRHVDVFIGEFSMCHDIPLAGWCAGGGGLGRPCQLNLERGLSSLGESALEPAERDVVAGRLERLRARIDAEPKSMKWRVRGRGGDRGRWDAGAAEEPGGAATGR